MELTEVASGLIVLSVCVNLTAILVYMRRVAVAMERQASVTFELLEELRTQSGRPMPGGCSVSSADMQKLILTIQAATWAGK